MPSYSALSSSAPCSILALWRVVALGVVITGTLPAYAADGLAEIAQREVNRRVGRVNEAQLRKLEAAQLLVDGKPAEALAIYQELLQNVPETPSTQALRAELKDGYALSACAEAQTLLVQARYADAGKLLDAALAVKPEDALTTKLQKQAADPDRYPPALTPGHLENTAKVSELLLLAGSCLELGDYDRSAKNYEAVLRVDRYNRAARNGLAEVEAKRAEYFNAARDQLRATALGKVNELWEMPLPPSQQNVSLNQALGMGANSLAAKAKEKMEQKLRNLKLPKVEFAAASLDEVVEYLRITSKDVDPEGRGIDFIVNTDEATRGKTLTLSLLDTPVEQILRYAVDLVGASFRVDQHAVIVTSLSERSTSLISRSYVVPPDFIQAAAVDTPAANNDPFAPAAAASATSGLALKRMSAKEFLESRGVTFPDGASANFSTTTSTLTVRNNADNLALVDTLVEQANRNAPKQAKISVRMIEVTQKTFDELGADLAMGQGNVPGSARIFGAGAGALGVDTAARGITGGLRGSGAVVGKASVDQLLSLSKGEEIPSTNSASPGAFKLLGVLTDPQFEATLYALAQKKGKDVLASPTILAKSGQKSSVRVVREFPYPTEFDPPEIPQSVGAGLSANVMPVVPTTPTTFEVKEIGTVLEVEPVISDDGRTVEISIAPSHTEFEGFVDYGSDIMAPGGGATLSSLLAGAATSTFVVDNPIIQPVFRRNSLSTSVIVWDGSTVALGALIRQEATQQDDKVPVVGDIPLVGRAFQNKISQVISKHLIFFVTVDVIDPAGRKVNAPANTAQN